jgi:hypothetical protein
VFKLELAKNQQMIKIVGVAMDEKFDPRCHIGETHGIYTIVDMLDEKDKYGHWIYKSVCNICGFEKFSHYGQISGPKSITTKCNHLRADGSYTIYGYTWNNKRIGHIFRGMVQRCYNSDDKSHKWYGEKGVGICKEWLNNPILFEEWSLNNGYTDGLTIDRIDSEKDYSPENCQWIPLAENTQKAGKVNWITIDDITLTGKQWAEKLGLGVNTINTYIRKYGVGKTKELIIKMLENPPRVKNINQSWFSVYGIQV